MSDRPKELARFLRKEEGRRRLLLHSCCGPCSCYPFLVLGTHYDVTVSFSNSNIYPREEWERRLRALRRAIRGFSRHYGIKIRLLEPGYGHDSFMEELRPMADLPEGSARCLLCYRKRMEEARLIARQEGIPLWCTTLTSSRQKDSEAILRIARELDQEDPEGPAFLLSDWKRGGGLEEGERIASFLMLYRQRYCGCEYSLPKRK